VPSTTCRSLLLPLLTTAVLLGAMGRARPALAECIDQNLADVLEQKRRRRDVKERLFIKAGRHEITAYGGLYAADLLGASFIVGGAYTYHMNDDFAVEGNFGYSRATLNGDKLLNRSGIDLVSKEDRRLVATGALVWTPFHAKLAASGPTIIHFDIGLLAGAGVVDTASSADGAFVGGLMMKFFFGRSWAIRLDFRDHVFRQELFGYKDYVNDLTFTMGVSTFLPTRY
jgi:outer membrane beta-barrel protein